MKRIVICKTCGKPEYWDDMRWISGKCLCRSCYKDQWERKNKKHYRWDDLKGHRPTMSQYEEQEG